MLLLKFVINYVGSLVTTLYFFIQLPEKLNFQIVCKLYIITILNKVLKLNYYKTHSPNRLKQVFIYKSN